MEFKREEQKRAKNFRRPTIRELAAEVGVSPATVSNAYNRPDQLSEELRERVFETARRIGYTGPDPTARSLRRRRAGAVGVLYADRLSYAFADPAAVEFLEGVSVASEEAGLGLLLVPGSPRTERDPAAVGNAVVDGFIVYCMAEEDPLMLAAVERRLPTVFVDLRPPAGIPGGIPYVGIDDAGAAYEAARHLTSLGHRRIGVVSFEITARSRSGFAGVEHRERATYRPTRSRLEGYRRAIEESGLDWAGTPVYECAENEPGEARRAAAALLQGPAAERPTAILAASDRLALGIMEAAREYGLRLPEDLSVVGFDDVPGAARSEPPLTTVHQDHRLKGLLAGRMLNNRLSGEEAEGEPRILPTQLVERGSVARPPADSA